MNTRSILAGLLLALGLGATERAAADEGMWLLNNPPRDLLKTDHAFEATDAWLERMQKSAVRFSTGGSGAIVSARGLVMTNHHVAAELIYDLSTPERDLLEEGFYAQTLEAELPVKDLKLDVLWQIEDVTDRVETAAEGLEPAEAAAARRAVMAEIESDSLDQTGLHSEVVTLYNGGMYHLYRYKRFTDVRLVFAPEQQAAFFGGDNDNFEFPRYNLDVALLRVYEDGRPLQPEFHLGWSEAGADDGDLVFVFGHPGRTQRLYTVDHLRFLRDVHLPQRLRWAWRIQAKLQEFAGRSPENARIAGDLLHAVENARKLWTGQLDSLQQADTIRRKQREENLLRSTLGRRSGADAGDGGVTWGELESAIKNVADAQDTHEQFYQREQVVRLRGKLFEHALHIVRLVQELNKPSGERLREYRDSNLPAIEQTLYADTPIYPEFEIALIEAGLGHMAEVLGVDDPLVARVLAGKSPRERAIEAVQGTRLFDPKMRRRIVTGSVLEVSQSDDSMLMLAKLLDPDMRALRERYEDEVESVEREAYATIARARFQAEGDSVYPDATFTLRMAFGPVSGYTEPDGAEVPAFTLINGMFERSAMWNGAPPFDLPDRWAARRDRIDMSTPMNFVYAADTIGGNSGSPVVDRDGDVVGLNFDSNLHKLGNNVMYIKGRARAIAVDARAIIEALRSVYDADRIADELLSQ